MNTMKKTWKKINPKSFIEFSVEQAQKSENISLLISHQDETKLEYSCVVEYKNKKVIEDKTVLNKILEKLEIIDQRFEVVEQRLDNIENRLDKIETRLDNIENRLDALEQRMERVEEEIKDIKECPTIKKELEIVRKSKKGHKK